jgi:hypothetical protein
VKTSAASGLIVGFLLLINLPASALYNFDFPANMIGRRYAAETRLKKDGSLFGQSVTKFEKLAYEGKTYLVMSSQSSGTIQSKPFSSTLVRYFLLADGKITSYSLRGETKSTEKPWTDYDIRFNWQALTVRVIYNDYSKKEKVDKTVRIGPDTVAIMDLDLYLTSLPSRKVKEEKLKALLPNGQTFGFLLKLTDQSETITVKGSSVLARRIELKPDLGLISAVIPNVNYWVSSEPPHTLVRYSGQISGPGSPDVVQEIFSLE